METREFTGVFTTPTFFHRWAKIYRTDDKITNITQWQSIFWQIHKILPKTDRFLFYTESYPVEFIIDSVLYE